MLDEGLFDMEAPPPVSLRDRFVIPPFSIMDRRAGEWQERRRRWLSLGIRSELGRDGGLISNEGAGYTEATKPIEQRSQRSLEAAALGNSSDAERSRRELARREEEARKRQSSGAPVPGGGSSGGAWFGRTAGGELAHFDGKWDGDRSELNRAGAHSDQDKLNAITGQETISGTSIFDPVICEIAYRWFCPPGGVILDPFAGGSVRGVIASALQRRYMGVELREVQVKANREQARLGLPVAMADLRAAHGCAGPCSSCEQTAERFLPRWKAGDSQTVLPKLPTGSVDFVWSCPPYADLEVYSDDPRDLSNMPYEEFCRLHDDIVQEAARCLKNDRFAAWVISDVRERRRGGLYRGLHHRTVESFERAGLHLYNEGIIIDPVGSGAVRAGRIFNGMRKTIRMHQLMYVFIKGDPKKATAALGESEKAEEEA